MDRDQMEAKIAEYQKEIDAKTVKNNNKTVVSCFGLTKDVEWVVGGKTIPACEFEETDEFQAILKELETNYSGVKKFITGKNGKLDNNQLKKLYTKIGVEQDAFWYAWNANAIIYLESLIEDLEKKIKALDNSDLETEAVTLGVDVEEELERQEELKGE